MLTLIKLYVSDLVKVTDVCSQQLPCTCLHFQLTETLTKAARGAQTTLGCPPYTYLSLDSGFANEHTFRSSSPSQLKERVGFRKMPFRHPSYTRSYF